MHRYRVEPLVQRSTSRFSSGPIGSTSVCVQWRHSSCPLLFSSFARMCPTAPSTLLATSKFEKFSCRFKAQSWRQGFNVDTLMSWSSAKQRNWLLQPTKKIKLPTRCASQFLCRLMVQIGEPPTKLRRRTLAVIPESAAALSDRPDGCV